MFVVLCKKGEYADTVLLCGWPAGDPAGLVTGGQELLRVVLVLVVYRVIGGHCDFSIMTRGGRGYMGGNGGGQVQNVQLG